MSNPLNIVLIVVGISLLVIVHECGHYFAARAFGMRVLKYSIGFGPTIFKYKPKDSPTTFQVAAIPFLAYVQIAGMNPHEEFDPDDPAIFPNKSAFARIVTIAAGPIANYLCAALIVFIIGLTGWPGSWLARAIPDHPEVQDQPVMINGYVEGGVAEAAGLRIDDQLLHVAGEEVHNMRHLQELCTSHKGEPTVFAVRRDGQEMEFTVTPDAETGRIGIRIGPPPDWLVELSAGEAAVSAFQVPWNLTVFQLKMMGQMIKERDTSNIGGPVGMGEMIGHAAESGPRHYFVSLMLLSVALGLFNLLPFPALDGGRLAFLGYEVITRRKPNERFELAVHTIGILFLLGVLILVTIRDIGRLGG